MKYLNLKLLFLSAIVIGFSSCDKVEKYEPLGDSGQKTISILTYGGIDGDGYANANLVADPSLSDDQIKLQLYFSTPELSTQDITVTIGYDADALAAFNANPDNPHYEKLPDSTYTFPETNVVIKAGETFSQEFFVTLHPDKIDGSINYMLPLSIKAITGAPGDVKASTGTSIAYLHFIGNPLAGFYNETGARYNFSGSVAWAGPPSIPSPNAGVTDYSNASYSPAFAAPLDGQTVKLAFGNVPDPAPAGGSAYYYITASSDFSTISYDFGANFNAGYSNIIKYVVSYTAPSATQKASFHLMTKYNNAVGNAGSDRLIDQTFVHQ